MSLEEEGPLTWYWRMVQFVKIVVDSPPFRYNNQEWFLRCETMNNTIKLWLCPKDSFLRHLSPSVSVQVWDGFGVGPDCSNVCQRVGRPDSNYSSTYQYIIWQRKISELMPIFPGLWISGKLTFKIQFTEGNPQTGAVSCPQTKLHFKNVTDASVQTSLTANSISCLNSLSEDIAKMLDVDSNPDVELHCEGNTTKAHGALLSVRSPVLAKMLQADMVEGRTRVVNIQGMDAHTFGVFLKYLHGGKLEQESLTFDLALRLYEAGDMYEVESLSKWCAQFLFQNLTVENACDALAVADAHCDSDLEEKITAFILENEIPLSDNLWSAFCEKHPKLAIKVYKMMVSKGSQHGQGFKKIRRIL